MIPAVAKNFLHELNEVFPDRRPPPATKFIRYSEPELDHLSKWMRKNKGAFTEPDMKQAQRIGLFKGRTQVRRPTVYIRNAEYL